MKLSKAKVASKPSQVSQTVTKRPSGLASDNPSQDNVPFSTNLPNPQGGSGRIADKQNKTKEKQTNPNKSKAGFSNQPCKSNGCLQNVDHGGRLLRSNSTPEDQHWCTPTKTCSSRICSTPNKSQCLSPPTPLSVSSIRSDLALNIRIPLSQTEPTVPCTLSATLVRVVKQPGDGNCLFHALCHNSGISASATDLRKELCAFYSEHAATAVVCDLTIQEWIEHSECTLAEYVDIMARNGSWGGELELASISILKKCTIVVYEPKDQSFHMKSSYSHPAGRVIRVTRLNDHYDSLEIIQRAPPPVAVQTPQRSTPRRIPVPLTPARPTRPTSRPTTRQDRTNSTGYEPKWSGLQDHWQVVRDIDLADIYKRPIDTMKDFPPFLTPDFKEIVHNVMQAVENHIPSGKIPRQTEQDSSNPVLSLALKLLDLLPVLLLRKVGNRDAPTKVLKQRFHDFKSFQWASLLKELGREIKELDNPFDSQGSTSEDCFTRGPTIDTEAAMDSMSTRTSRKVTACIRESNIAKAARIAVSTTSYTAPSATSFNRLKTKHPKRLDQDELSDECLLFFPEDEAVITVSPGNIWQAIHKSKKDIAPGPSGWRFEHLKKIGDHGNAPWITHFTAIVNAALQQRLPAHYMTRLAGANLVAIGKSNNDIRPIAMSETFRKVIAKVASESVAAQIQTALPHYQYGVGTRNGTEVITHWIKQRMSQESDLLLLTTDFSNAFNSISRACMLRELQRTVPGLFPLVRDLYWTPSKLWTATSRTQKQFISSEQGVQQGDVLGPLLFCLTVQPMLDKLNAGLQRQGEALAYMDDFSFIIRSQLHFTASWNLLNDEASKVGLTLNAGKCCIHGSEGSLKAFREVNSDLDALDIIPTSSEGAVVLGSPIGTQVYCTQHWFDRLSEIRKETEIICNWSRKQEAMVLFRLCIVTKFSFILRSLQPQPWAEDLIDEAQKIIRDGFSRLLMMNPDDYQNKKCWQQASLPPHDGGFGLLDPVAIHPLAFLASESQCAKQIATLKVQLGYPVESAEPALSTLGQSILQNLSEKSVYPSFQQLLLSKKPQEKLTEIFLRSLKSDLLEDLPTRIRLEANSFEAACLVTCIPKYESFTFDTPSDFVDRCRARLGLPLLGIASIPNCLCSASLDSKGIHLLNGCKKGTVTQDNHTADIHALRSIFRSLNFNVKLEDNHAALKENDYETKERVDLTVPLYVDRRHDLALDVSIVNTESPSYSQKVDALRDREANKISHYASRMESAGHKFEPFVLSAGGRFAPSTKKLFEQMVALKGLHGQSLNNLRYYWRCKIVMALHICAAKGIRAKIADIRKTVARREGDISELYEDPDEFSNNNLGFQGFVERSGRTSSVG